MRNKAYGHALGGQRNRSCREREALGIDVVVGVPRIDRRVATRAGYSIWEVKRVAALLTQRITTAPERRGEWQAVVHLENAPDLPAPVDHQDPADIVIGHGAALAQIEPIEAGDGIRQRIARNRT